MPGSPSLPPDLEQAAAALELRLRLLGAPISKEPMEKWDALPESTQKRVPPWLPVLLSRYALSGVQLLFPHPTISDEPPAFLTFLAPDAYRAGIDAEFDRLPDLGFHVFAWECNRDVWVTTAEAGPTGDVFVLEASSWDRGQLSVKNGLRHAHTRLASLLSIAAIGQAGDGDWKGYAIWFQEPKEVSEHSRLAFQAEMRALTAENEGRIADALAAYMEWEACLKWIDENHPTSFNTHRQEQLQHVAAKIALLRAKTG